MLYRAAAEPAFAFSIPATAMAESGVMTSACATARTRLEARNCGPEKSPDRFVARRLPAMNRTYPTVARSRGSTRRISLGIKGMMANWGRPIQISTAPICSAL